MAGGFVVVGGWWVCISGYVLVARCVADVFAALVVDGFALVGD